MVTREHEWNAHIDDYINDPRRAHDDPRPAIEIERACKIDRYGGPMYKTCASPGCGNVEETKDQFKKCSKCSTTPYCSAACQKASWKPTHKAECGTAAGQPRLKSEVAASAAVDGFLQSPEGNDDAFWMG